MLTPIFFLLILFGFKTYQASGYYRNSIVFYEKSIETNLNNVPIIYNLSTMYLASGKNDEAFSLLQAFIEASQREPYLRDSRYFPFLVQMHSQINQGVDK
jgi:tetratricopeptide (TPR) repeat protein